MKEHPPPSPFWAHILSGSMAGASAAVLTAPLDLAKTRLQVQYNPVHFYAGKTYSPRYRGMLGTLATTLREEGPRGWFKGLGSYLLGLVPSWALYFTMYNHLKTLQPLPVDSLVAQQVYAAWGAGVFTSCLTNPLWVVKVRLQTQFVSKQRYDGIRHAFVRIYAREGVKGFFRGLSVSLLGTLHVAIQFPLYEYLKRSMAKDQDVQELDLQQVLFSSLVSKVVATSITYPHEVLRSRFQGHSRRLRGHSVVSGAAAVFREEGFRAFFHGLGTNLIRVVPSCAITFTVYEYSLCYITSRWAE